MLEIRFEQLPPPPPPVVVPAVQYLKEISPKNAEDVDRKEVQQ